MTKRLRFTILVIWVLVFAVLGISAQKDEEKDTPALPKIPYCQSHSFNVPLLQDWENQSTETVAQFYNADAQATIRTTFVDATDPAAGIKADLEAFLNTSLTDPMYNNKVNLADGTWHVQIFTDGDDTVASAMAKQVDGRVYVVSFVESNPDVQIYMLAIEQADDAVAGDPSAEIMQASSLLGGVSLSDSKTSIDLPSGTWQMRTDGEAVSAMGMTFGNDSFIALKDGADIDLPALADAYNTTLLGFFITPDNSPYLYMGLVVVFGTLIILAGSIVWRRRNLEKDLAVLQQLAKNDA